MKRLRWQLLVVVLALAAIGVLLLGQKPDLLPGVIPEVKPTSGGSYEEALIGSLARLNPVLDYYNSADHDVDRLLFSGLVRFDDRGVPRGDVAETWGISQDGTTYNFSIRQNAVWHDGEPITSEDVIFTVELLRSEQIPIPTDLREFWNQIELEALDEKTLQFRLPESFAPFLDYLTFGLLPSHLLGDLAPEDLVNADFNLDPVGSGPYRFDHLIVEEGQIKSVVLSVFEDYYAGPAFIEQITFTYFPDAASALNAYQQGDVMGLSQVNPEILPQALKLPTLNLYTSRMPRLSMIYLNLDNGELPFFQDPAVRKALLAGLNRQWIVDRLMGGQALIANGPILPGTWAYYDGIEQVEFDPDTALDLLKEAGYTVELAANGESAGGNVRSKEGVALAFEMLYPDEPPYQAVAESIQADWSRLGVRVDLKAVPYEDLLSDYLEPRAYQAALVDLNLARSPDPDPYPFWHQAQATGGQNYARWDDRQASEYLEQARVLVDASERLKRYKNFQVRFTNEMPALPLFYPVYTYAVDNQVEGISVGPLFDPSDRFNSITSWYLEAREATDIPVEATATP